MKENNYEDEDFNFEDFAIQLADMLEVALYFAGAKKDKLQDAANCYLDCLDEVFYDEDDPEIGVDEIIEVIKHLKKKHPEFF